MANIRFNLNKPKQNAPTQIYLIYWINSDDRLKFYTGYKIHPNNWNPKTNKPKPSKENHHLILLLDSIANHLDKLIIDARIKNISITSMYLKNELNARFQIRKRSETGTFLKYCNQLITRRLNDPSYKIGTIKTYKLTVANISKFDPGVTFERITIQWHEKFCAWMYGRGLSSNYVNQQTKKIKMFLNAAMDDGINVNTDFKKRRFTTPEKKTPKPYLTESEILQLYNYDYGTANYLRNTVNIFTLGCFTGLRFSDLIKINKDKHTQIIDGKYYLNIRTQKTDHDVTIPLNDICLDIILNNKIKNISNQKLNDYLKTAGMRAGLNQTTKKISYPGGKIKIEYFPKYALISAHTARRSFATNMYKKNIPSQYIMRITGHKSEKSFMDYLSFSNTETAQKINEIINR